MLNPQFAHGHTTFKASILSARRDVIARVTVHAQLEQLKKTGRYECFELKWHPTYNDKTSWPVPPHLFWDSDLAKWIEGACYFLGERFDAEVDAAIKYIVSTIQTAQAEDGYLNLHYTVVEPGKRWTNLRDMHELYNAGHLIEAALAHHQYYRNNDLLEPIRRYVKLIRDTFGPNETQRHGYPGHPEIELALFRLYRATGDQNAYDLAHYFLTERGNTTGQDGMQYFDWEAQTLRGESRYMRPDYLPTSQSHWYFQAHLPILKQETVEGHAVRCMYLLTAVADMVALSYEDRSKLNNIDEWFNALKKLWSNMVDQKMYSTGGIGAERQWEGFGKNYFLPQSLDEGGCYAETCASIGVMMLAERLLMVDLDSRYADIMELCLYNNVMTAMSLDGRHFTYVNHLGSSDNDISQREDWFEVSCCPPNLIRLFGSLGGYIWHSKESQGSLLINVHLYTNADLNLEFEGQKICLKQRTGWPWDGRIDFELLGAENLKTTLHLRIPGWAQERYTLSPAPQSTALQGGYLVLEPAYVTMSPKFTLEISGFKPRFLSPHPYTNQHTLTLARGPIVYCVEDVDNSWEENHFKDVSIKTDSPITEVQCSLDEYSEKYVALASRCWKRAMTPWTSIPTGSAPGAIVTGEEPNDDAMEHPLVFVPYYLRANRGGRGQMRVGLTKFRV